MGGGGVFFNASLLFKVIIHLISLNVDFLYYTQSLFVHLL